MSQGFSALFSSLGGSCWEVDGGISLRRLISPLAKRLTDSSPFWVEKTPILISFFERETSVSLIEKLGIFRKSSLSSGFLRRRELRMTANPDRSISSSFPPFAYLYRVDRSRRPSSMSNKIFSL